MSTEQPIGASSERRDILDLAELYARVLQSPGNEELLRQLRDRVHEVRSWLDQDAEAAARVDAVDAVDPQWLARVYAVLAESDQQGVQDNAWDEMRRDYRIAEYGIGEAFVTGLLVGLSPQLMNLEEWFGGLSAVPDHQQRGLAEFPDVMALGDGDPKRVLVRCGLHPVRIWYVTSAVVDLVERLVKHGQLPAGTHRVAVPRWGETPRASDSWPAIPPTCLQREVVQMARCGSAAAKILWNWLWEVSDFRPYLFAGGLATRLTPDLVGIEVMPDCAQRIPALCWGLTETMKPPRLGEKGVSTGRTIEPAVTVGR